MIPRENVVVVVTNEGYIKRVSSKSYQASKEEETNLKPGDYPIGLYELNTLDTLLLFTNQGRYLFVPVHAIPEAKWKELGKHINNVIGISPEEKIIASIVYKDKENNVILFTKNGLAKRSVLKDFEVSRYTKPMVAFKLKENDEVVSVFVSKKEAICITKTGYFLRFDSEEIPLVGIKASGVKAINLKDDEVISGVVIDENDEYLNIFTKQRTAKRVKLSDLETTNRAKKGSRIMKKVKTNDYNVLSAYITNGKSLICIKADSEIREEKNSELPIMDLQSNGSSISKYDIDGSFVKVNLISYLNKKEDKDLNSLIKQNDSQELTIDDFIDDFKL